MNTDHFLKIIPFYIDGREDWYHNIDHIIDLIKRMHEHAPVYMHNLLYLAILYHDIVYDIPKPGFKLETSNELLSEIEFYKACYKELNQHELDLVGQMIAATEHHFDGTTYENPHINMMLDLDILGFASPWREFKEAQSKIENEYFDNGYTWDQIVNGRLLFLKNIFENKLLKFRILTKYEQPAYENLKRLIDVYEDYKRDLV